MTLPAHATDPRIPRNESRIDAQGRTIVRAQYAPRGLLAVHRASLGAWFDFTPPPPFREESGVAIVTISGPLQNQPSWWGDDYGCIRERVAAAFASPCAAVALELDSPGGEVFGCFDLARDLRAMADASRKPFVASVSGMAASAAYALACACDQIAVPEAGMVGSVGVLSTFVDETAWNEKLGFRFEVVASGARKTDGVPCVAITPEALAEAQAQVDQLATVFFDWVASRRPGLTREKLASFEAGVFFGAAGVSAGLADRVSRLSELLSTLAPKKPATAFAAKATSQKGKGPTMATYDELVKQLRDMAAGEGDDAAKAKDAISKLEPMPMDPEKEPDPADPAEPNEPANPDDPADGEPKKGEAAEALAGLRKITGSAGMPVSEILAVVRGWAAKANAGADLAKRSEFDRRVAAVRALVVAGAELPSNAWKLDADGMPDGKNPAAPWDTIEIGALEARVVRASKGKPALKIVPPASDDATEELSDREKKMCAKEGLDPSAYLAKKKKHLAKLAT